MKKVLHIETFPFSPHLETSAEIAIRQSKTNKVYFFWAGYDLPWTDWKLPFFKTLLGMNYEKKIEYLNTVIEKFNIKKIDKIELDKKIIKDIDRWIVKFDENTNLRKVKYKKFNIGIGALSSFISFFQNDNPKLNKRLVQNALKSSALVYERTKEIVKIIKPDLIVTFNNRFGISLPILEIAKKKNIKYLCHENGSNVNKYQIFEKSVHDVNERCEQIFTLWKNTGKIKRIKSAQKFFNLPFTKSKINFNLAGTRKNLSLKQISKIELNKKFKYVVFFCSSNYEFQAISNDFYDDLISTKWRNQIQVVESLCKTVKKIKDMKLIVRIHPQLTQKQDESNSWNKFSKYKDVIFISAKSKINSFDLLKKADIVASFGSSLAVHAVYHGKPSISFRKHDFSCSKVLIHPKNENDLLKILKKKNL